MVAGSKNKAQAPALFVPLSDILNLKAPVDGVKSDFTGN
jgi:hypothetical protein